MTHTTAHTTHTCQYIGGDGYKPTCTHKALAGHSYCAEHLAVVYKAGTARARRKKDERVAAAVWDLESAMHEAVAELEAEGFDVWGDSERVEA
jgi:hypothetical protein